MCIRDRHLSDIRPPEIEIELEKEIEIEKEREGEAGHPAPAAYGLSLIHIYSEVRGTQ